MRKIVLFTLIVLAGNVRANGQQKVRGFDPAQHKSIGHLRNLYEIDSGVYRSAQPRRRSFEAMSQAGIQEILNLRRHKNVDSLRRGSTSMILIQVPLKARKLNEQHIVDALRVIKNRQGPILIHCWKGSDRTGLICAMYRIIFDDWSKDAALQEMEHGGFGFHKTYKEIPRYIRHANVDSIRKIMEDQLVK